MVNLSSIFKSMLYLLGIAISGYASGHASISPTEVPKNSYQKLTFNITHGCGDSPTKEVIIFIPEEFMGAKPLPKYGWSIEIEKKDLEKPYISHGKEVKSDVRKISWKGGKLPNEYADEFSIRVRVIDKSGNVPVIVHQICEVGKWEWSELPTQGKKLVSPAPILKITGSENHQHH
jgi:periplasmic copper chaperone A